MSGGMFGASPDWGQAIAAALNGYLAAGGNQIGALNLRQMHDQMLAKQQQELAAKEYEQHRKDQMADWMTQEDYRAKHRPPGDFEQALIDSGVQPGTPEWKKAMTTRRDIMLDPIVNAGMYGPMMRSQVVGNLKPQVAPPGVTFTPLPPENGGAPGAVPSPGFLGF